MGAVGFYAGYRWPLRGLEGDPCPDRNLGVPVSACMIQPLGSTKASDSIIAPRNSLFSWKEELGGKLGASLAAFGRRLEFRYQR